MDTMKPSRLIRLILYEKVLIMQMFFRHMNSILMIQVLFGSGVGCEVGWPCSFVPHARICPSLQRRLLSDNFCRTPCRVLSKMTQRARMEQSPL